ncbi:hypothetical protein Tcan_06213 [Toxocara canis]|uniref:Uncharacterized protein n=1 Tax=Toxocara canis TaxID=6265 RepID=A0A0B2URG2_TOXCA|nr:hypothetical protein Tcan_06213 [Toxocara canis]
MPGTGTSTVRKVQHYWHCHITSIKYLRRDNRSTNNEAIFICLIDGVGFDRLEESSIRKRKSYCQSNAIDAYLRPAPTKQRHIS